MVIAFNRNAGRGSEFRSRSRVVAISRDREKGKVICIARGWPGRFGHRPPEPEDWPEYEPPKGA
jgi:hypothetical protein